MRKVTYTSFIPPWGGGGYSEYTPEDEGKIMSTEIGCNTQESTGISEEQADEALLAVFVVEGMTCASCALRVEKGFLKKVPGVRDASVNLVNEQATVTYEPTQAAIEHMAQKVEAVRYKASPLFPPATSSHPSIPPAHGAHNQAEQAAWYEQRDDTAERNVQEAERRLGRKLELIGKRNLLILGIILTVLVVFLSMFFMNRFPGENFLLLLLTTPVWAIVGWEFHWSALKTLRHFGTNEVAPVPWDFNVRFIHRPGSPCFLAQISAALPGQSCSL
jgi:Cu+-exporting ATPase